MLVASLAGATIAAGALYLYTTRESSPAKRLIAESKRLFRKKAYEASLAAATEACQLAADGSQHRIALLHLAALHHAMNRFDDSLATLDKVEAVVTDDLDLVPLLHARAEVLEAADRPLELAAEQLARARDVRRRASGPESMEAAYAAFNLARVLTLQSQKAEDAAALLQQAESLVLEAHGIALAAGDATQAATFVDEILELLTADSAACATASQLRAAYLEASGEEWSPKPLDVLIVGAGASGVGMGILLTKVFRLRPQRVLLVERGGGVGESFLRWPREMRFISPSFNQQGWTKSFDLNSVVYGTSPAFTLHAEHPTGEQYARYLRALAERAKLAVRTGTEVEAVRRRPDGSFEAASPLRSARHPLRPLRPLRPPCAPRLTVCRRALAPGGGRPK